MTWPVGASLTTHVVGSGGDSWQTLWRFEDKSQLLKSAITEGNIFPFIYQEFLGGSEAQLVNLSVWPWMWLHLLFGQPLAYNLIYLLSFVLSGYTVFLLTTWLFRKYAGTTNYLVSFLAGLIYMFLPYHVAHGQGHFGTLQTFWLPLAILTLFWWFEKPILKRTTALALA